MLSGSNLVLKAIRAMVADDADEVRCNIVLFAWCPKVSVDKNCDSNEELSGHGNCIVILVLQYRLVRCPKMAWV